MIEKQMDEDLKLVHDFLRGDEDAFRKLVDKYKKKVYYTAYHLVGNHEDAMDLSQEAFISAFKSLAGFRGRSNFYTWLYRITVNRCLNHLKMKSRYTRVSLDDGMETMDKNTKDITDGLSNEELRERIKTAVAVLPEQQRAVFVLRNYDGLSHKDISNILNISVGAVKAHYSLSVQKLRMALGDLARNNKNDFCRAGL